MIVGLSSVAVTTAVLPHLSKAFSTRDFRGARQIIHTYSSVILLATIPVTFLLIHWSSTIVRVLFERNAFTRSDTLLVSTIQRAFLLQIPLHVLGMLFVSIVWALRANWVFLVINPICLIGKIFLNSVLVGIYGVAGIGLATSIIYSLSCLLLLLAVTILIKRDSTAVNSSNQIMSS
jgi:putative peptidoglycan lipid II flippase